MKFLNILVISLILSISSTSFAKVCFSGSDLRLTKGSVYSLDQAMAFNTADNYSIDLLQPASFGDAISCKHKEVFQDGLKVTSMLIQAGSLYATCSGLLPVVLKLEAAALVVGAVDIVVSHVPCTEKTSEEDVKAMLDEDICWAMESNGVECRTPIYQDLF